MKILTLQPVRLWLSCEEGHVVSILSVPEIDTNWVHTDLLKCGSEKNVASSQITGVLFMTLPIKSEYRERFEIGNNLTDLLHS